MVNRVVVTLEQFEYSALLKMAVKELRNPSDQLRTILRDELRRQGSWPPPDTEQSPMGKAAEGR